MESIPLKSLLYGFKKKHIHGYNILTINITNNTLREHSLPLPSGGPGSQGQGVQGGGSNTFWVSLSHS